MLVSIGNQRITGTEKITGLQIGNLYIHTGGSLIVDGLVIGNITIATGASLSMNGLVVGDLIDLGGCINVKGFVWGRRSHAGSSNEKIINPNHFLSNTRSTRSVKPFKQIK
jgi:hypothetical protein